MKSGAFLEQITLRSYLHHDSIIHRLSPPFKIIMLILTFAACIIATSLSGLLFFFLFLLSTILLSRIPLRSSISGIKIILPFLVLIMVLQILFIRRYDGGRVLLEFWIVRISSADIYIALQTMMRIIDLVLVINLFSLSVRSTDLPYAAEQLLTPLSRIGFPSRALSLIFMISLRFLPILAMEADRLMKAQASRGADFEKRLKKPFGRITAYIPVLIPVFIQAGARAEHLVQAMEARCFSESSHRGYRKRFYYHTRDYIGLIITLIVSILIILPGFIDFDLEILGPIIRPFSETGSRSKTAFVFKGSLYT